MRVIAEQNADGVFFLGNLPLEFRNLRICGVEHLLRLKHIQLCGHAVIEAELVSLTESVCVLTVWRVICS